MGQKDKARQIVEEQFNFERLISAPQDDVEALVDRVASQTRVGLGGSICKTEVRDGNKGRLAYYVLTGPGGLVKIATMTVHLLPHDGELGVLFKVEDCLFQKGSFGMKPTINGAKHLKSFVSALTVELEARGAHR